MTERTRRGQYSPEVRERAVRMVEQQRHEHGSQWAAIVSISGKIGCSAQSLHNWVTQAWRDVGMRAGPTSEERDWIRTLKCENRELRAASHQVV